MSQKTELVVILDRSGSMASLKTDVEGGFKTFIDEQKQVPGDCGVTLVQFDSESVETVYSGESLDLVPPLVLTPRGGTPLLDAMGTTIMGLIDRFKTDL